MSSTKEAPRAHARRRIAVIGGGPIGLEAALYAARLGHDVTLFERGEVARNVRGWGFVELFSPWRLNTSPLGLAVLRENGAELPPPDDFPTGHEMVERYLEPIARALGPSLRPHTQVVAIARQGHLKGEAIGSTDRALQPFRLLVRDRETGREETHLADGVIDATGVYDQPGCLGDGGIPAPGERVASDHIAYHLPDVLGSDRGIYENRTVLLVGAGFSAATALVQLVELSRRAPRTRVLWARRDTRRDPFPEFENDPLPQRARLSHIGNGIALVPPETCEVFEGVTVDRIAPRRGGDHELRVALRSHVDDRLESVDVDRIIALVGYRPDLELHRELQVHSCYASEGPMKLAAALLGAEAAGDCLAQESPGPSALANPEPGFYVVGHKSYGRRSDFLLAIGREQIRDVFRLLESDPELDLYAEAETSSSTRP